ncbi:TolB family protein [Conexibacter woesei]|uniref:TolB family protein n=1 Tax=Conexibacter woesei TaxID=191495 RepID=UPI0003F78895|nr:PD40 domain-containing protein [Conexibacter woesei]
MLAISTFATADAHADAAAAPRVPELVSPSDKGGNDIFTAIRNAKDGDTIAYQSLGAFADVGANPLMSVYRSHRTASGWVTDGSLTPIPASPAPALNDSAIPAGITDDVSTAFYTVGQASALTPLDQNSGYDVASVNGGQSTWLSPGLRLPDTASGDSIYEGSTPDGSHVVIESTKQLIPSIAGGTNRVYDYSAGRLRLASVPPSGGPNPASEAAQFGGGHNFAGLGQAADARAISTDGSHIYFQMDGQLYVRIDGKTTNLISASRVAGDPRGPVSGAAAKFLGASDDGHIVFFSAVVPLTSGATTGGIYMYDEEYDTLRRLAGVDASAGRSILGSLRTSSDGARIYFASNAALAPGATDDRPNVYVAGDVPVTFVATVGFGDSFKLYSNGEYNNEIALSPDGRSLAFPSTNVLAGPRAGQADATAQLYLYNLDGNSVSCLSCPPDGSVPAGESSLRDIPGNQQSTPPGFAADGTVFFDSPNQLTADDTDGKYDVYAHDADGNHLVSVNTPTRDALVVGSSADGRDVFIRTSQTLTDDDRDGGYADIYDMRVGGGFPSTATTPCEGEACRGPQSAPPAPAAAPTSLTATDTSAPVVFTTPATTFKVSSISAAARATWARTGRVTLSVKVSDTAQVTARATAKLAGSKKAATVASATQLREGAGTVKLVLTLSSKARSALKRSHKLTVSLAVTCTDSKKAAHATVVLRTKAAKR